MEEEKEYIMKEDFDKADEEFDLAGDEAYDDFINSEEYMYSHIQRMEHLDSIMKNAVDSAIEKLKDAPEEEFANILEDIVEKAVEESGGLLTYFEVKERILAALEK